MPGCKPGFLEDLDGSGLMPRHARDSRGRWPWAIGRWLLSLGVAGLSAAYEADRLADARATVASGWAVGIVVGAGGGLVLAALVAMTPLVQRQRPWSRYSRPQAALGCVLILTTALLLVVAIFTSTPPGRYESRPVTSGIEVAAIAYIGILSIGFAVGLIAWLVAQVREHRRATRR